MSGFDKITIQKARPLPVLVLADISGSMGEHGKIEALNKALGEMIRSLGQQSSLNAEIHIGIITFGEEVRPYSDPKPASQYESLPIFSANGGTPFGEALSVTQKILENKDLIPSRSYRPTVVVISDGLPTDDWEKALEAFLASDRGSKATRLAMTMGPDANEEVLTLFINDPEIPVIYGKDARDIERFFKCVTMSVTSRSVQSNPNMITQGEIKNIFEDEELDF
ncbi:MAG: VWA domain-containing protein [Planctomycetota bacterium]